MIKTSYCAESVKACVFVPYTRWGAILPTLQVVKQHKIFMYQVLSRNAKYNLPILWFIPSVWNTFSLVNILPCHKVDWNYTIPLCIFVQKWKGAKQEIIVSSQQYHFRILGNNTLQSSMIQILYKSIQKMQLTQKGQKPLDLLWTVGRQHIELKPQESTGRQNRALSDLIWPGHQDYDSITLKNWSGAVKS